MKAIKIIFNQLFLTIIFLLNGVYFVSALGTRAMAMGGASIGDYNQVDTVFYNPASLALQTNKYVLVGGEYTNVSRDFLGINNYLAINAPLSARIGLGMGSLVYRYNLTSFGNINFGEGVLVSDIKSVLDTQQYLIYNYATKMGKKLNGKINFGLKVYEIKRKLNVILKDGSEKWMLWSGITVDAGLLLKLSKNFSAGFIANNLNKVFILEPTAKSYSVGGSIRDSNFVVNADYVGFSSGNNSKGEFRVGGEIKFNWGGKGKGKEKEKSFKK